jgi:hypothetical protein
MNAIRHLLRLKRYAIGVCALLILATGCEDYLRWEYPVWGATLTVPNVTAKTSTTAEVSSTVNLVEGMVAEQTGIAYHTQPNPTWDNLAEYGDGSATISVSIQGLTPNTTYYLRSFVISNGTAYYSSQKTFTTDGVQWVKTGSNNCSSLNGTVSSFRSPNGTNAPWGIGNNGHSGAYWAAPDPNGSSSSNTGLSWISFDHSFNKPGKVRFWVQTHNPGYNNKAPEILLNGVSVGYAQQVGGELSSWYWMQVETPVIPSGNQTLTFQFNSGATYVDLGVDELEFFEYP